MRRCYDGDGDDDDDGDGDGDGDDDLITAPIQTPASFKNNLNQFPYSTPAYTAVATARQTATASR